MKRYLQALICVLIYCAPCAALAAACSAGAQASFELGGPKMLEDDQENLQAVLKAAEELSLGKKIAVSIYVHSANKEGKTLSERASLSRARKEALRNWVHQNKSVKTSVQLVQPDDPPPGMDARSNYAIVEFRFSCRHA